jgi:hypothetical protein
MRENYGLMLTPNDFVVEWQDPPGLVRFSEQAIATLHLSADSKAFLRTAGLPLSQITPCITHVYPELPIVADIYRGEYAMPEECFGLRVCAEHNPFGDVLSYYTLEEPSGNVFCIGKWVGRSYAKMFMNSSISHFAEFLLVHARYFRCVNGNNARVSSSNRRQPDQALMKECSVRALIELRGSDPRACAEADHFLRTGEMPGGSSLPKQEWTETVINMEKMGYWY